MWDSFVEDKVAVKLASQLVILAAVLETQVAWRPQLQASEMRLKWG